ncbi:MAG: hypothetical protein ACLGJC_08365 [Alphaproteobacteria bacterium]
MELIVGAIKRGGLLGVIVDILPTQIGEAAHVWLPAATAPECFWGYRASRVLGVDRGPAVGFSLDHQGTGRLTYGS